MDLKRLTSTEQMILDELRDIRRDCNQQLEKLNLKIYRIESSIEKRDDSSGDLESDGDKGT